MSAASDVELKLLSRVLDALFREDYAGIRSHGGFLDEAAHRGARGEHSAEPRLWSVRLPGAVKLTLPLVEDGFLADYSVAEGAVAEGAVEFTDDQGRSHALRDLEELFTALAPQEDPEAEAGWQEFRLECLQTVVTLQNRQQAATELLQRLSAENVTELGFAGALQFEALAALGSHPVHPTGSCRWGMELAEQRQYCPEYLPEFETQWITAPSESLRISPALAQQRPSWWPGSASSDSMLVPVHPLTLAKGGPQVLHQGTASLANVSGPMVSPTLSIRSMVPLSDPRTQLKLPLPISTLGRKNRRGIKAGDLADGATMQSLLQKILDREPELAARIVLADESRWLAGEDDSLAVLIRSYPEELSERLLLPLAALHAPDPRSSGTKRTATGVPARLIDRLAQGDSLGWFEEYLRTLFDWHLALWLRYGVALESHQQNITLALRATAARPDGSVPRIRLVYKDNDGARVDLPRLASALGEQIPRESFNDQRMLISEATELADMFTTITLHLCVAAPILDESEPGTPLRQQLFQLVRSELTSAMERWTDPGDAASVAAARLLRERVLDAERLPVKGMVTAGTLLPKTRLGCEDINKYYLRSGPNYLLPGSQVQRVRDAAEDQTLQKVTS
ncbi:IucA/IucC family protein [Psychromicrobium sp. YIM B11713]|uniref:IucA/IucC family protein n=1 Tax=Psychromicrobium sp. YIM B11713 TaxID=3145233 RepID=UPI00374F8467